MGMIDNCDGFVTMLSDGIRRARREHRCRECGRVIAVGERYKFENYIWEGDLNYHKTCAHCLAVREWLCSEHGGFVYGQVSEEVRENSWECPENVPLKMMAAGIERGWVRRDGGLWRVPRS